MMSLKVLLWSTLGVVAADVCQVAWARFTPQCSGAIEQGNESINYIDHELSAMV